jgi:hypothetical protein
MTRNGIGRETLNDDALSDCHGVHLPCPCSRQLPHADCDHVTLNAGGGGTVNGDGVNVRGGVFGAMGCVIDCGVDLFRLGGGRGGVDRRLGVWVVQVNGRLGGEGCTNRRLTCFLRDLVGHKEG